VPTGTPAHPAAGRTDPWGMTAYIRRAAALATVSAALICGAFLASAPASAATTDASYEAKVIALTNDARVKNGCAALRTDSKLTTAARAHSADMAKNNYFSHTGLNGSTFVTRVKATGYTTPSGENIAWGYRTPDTVMTGWMNSTGHRANILNCASKAIGVGIARKADGTPYWTQEFGSA
jgi:uncharacterized protein YkwD